MIMVPNQLIKTTISSNTKSHYEALGFNQKKGSEIFVKPEQLMDNSIAIEERICDCCGKRYNGTHQKMVKSFAKFNNDYCPFCVKNNPDIRKIVINKRKATNNIVYGYDAPSQNKEILEKIIETNQKKYGVNSTLELSEVKNKIKNTIKEKYNVDNPMQNIQIKEKAQNTNLQKYGVKNPMQNEDILSKAQETNMKKYGYKTSALNPEVRSKMINTLVSNGTIPTSSQQNAVFDFIKELYPGYECELNHQLSSIALDVYLKYEDILIDIEYDGRYWHRDPKKDYARDCFVKSCGYKVLRIRSGKLIPTKQELFYAVEELKNSDITFKEIILSDWEN